MATDAFNDWAGARLDQTLGTRAAAAPQVTNGGGMDSMAMRNMGAMQTVFKQNLPPLPVPTLDQMDMAFHQGAEAHKRVT